jgi:formate hydrogenlyase subunit 6/NADH:ubiquinone oxidoreductase subunit I
MTQELKQSYRGVLCASCKQAIPVPAIVVSMETESGDTEPSIRVFNLRCRACEKEHPYCSTDIVEFDGAPRARTRARVNSGAPPRRLGRAAHA